MLDIEPLNDIEIVSLIKALEEKGLYLTVNEIYQLRAKSDMTYGELPVCYWELYSGDERYIKILISCLKALLS